jgi:ATP-dependent Clp protease ATP-binding subunit ClpA
MTDWIDITEMARQGRLDPVVGREQEIERAIGVLLRRTRNNPLLVGAPGVGKTAIVEGLAQRIAQNAVPAALSGARIDTFDLGLALAQARARGESRSLETLFSDALAERQQERGPDGNSAGPRGIVRTILFIDELHLFSASAADGVGGMVNLLKLALRRGEVSIISETTPEHYQQYRTQAANLDQYFQVIPVAEPTLKETIAILRGVVDRYEAFHEVTIADDALTAATALAARYLPQRALPDKAIDLIDEATGRVRARGAVSPATQAASPPRDHPTVTEVDIAEVVSLWAGVPLEQIVLDPDA